MRNETGSASDSGSQSRSVERDSYRFSETLGYVVEVATEDATLAATDGDAIMVSSDGRTWHLAGPARSDYGMSFFLAASDGNLLVRDDAFNLWLWTNNP